MKYTKEIFLRLSRGQFISSNSVDRDTRAIYNDIEDNLQEYSDYFGQIDFKLMGGDGYFYFSRDEPRQIVENKLLVLFKWIDYVDFLKNYDTTFGAGTQFRIAHMESVMASDPELREKLLALNIDHPTNHGRLRKMADEMVEKGFAELINADDEEFQVTSAFGYIEQIIMSITINDDLNNEIPE